MSKIYAAADKALQRLYKYVEARFQQIATTTSWDEMNVIQSVSEAYRDIDTMAQMEYLQVAREAYRRARKEVPEGTADVPEEKDMTVFLLLLLAAYDEKTEYRYDREWERKRDRLAESILSLPPNEQVVNGNALRQALQRGMNLMNGQLRNFADTVTDEARREAFRDLGIDKVMWHTQQDSRVCAECAERDGEVYPLYGVPPKHRRCRCWLTAYEPDSNP